MTPATEPIAETPAELRSMRDLYERYGAAWAVRDAETIASFHAEDGIFHLHAAADAVRGRDAIRGAFAGFIAQVPDIAFAEQEASLGGWGWVVRWTMSGTLAQPLEMAGGRAEPGGRFEVDALDAITVVDGELTAKHTYVDAVTLFEQVGLA